MKLIVNEKSYSFQFNNNGDIVVNIDKNFTVEEVMFYMDWEKKYNLNPLEHSTNLLLNGIFSTYTVYGAHPVVHDGNGTITFKSERILETKLPNI